MTRTWIDSERQGPGRRDWFRTMADATSFAIVRRGRGYHISHDTDCGTTVWVSNGKARTLAVARVQAGVDAMAEEETR